MHHSKIFIVSLLMASLSAFFPAGAASANDEKSNCSVGERPVLWAPADRSGPSVIAVEKEGWGGFDNYDGYFWMYHAFKWNDTLLENLANSNCAKAGELDEGVYEFRRGREEGEGWEYWDGVWSRVELEWFLFFPYTERRIYSEYISSLPGAGNKGTEETDDWFADKFAFGFDTRNGFSIVLYSPVAWYFDNCGLAEPRADSPSKCDEEYEIGFDWRSLQPNRYYYSAIKFRTDSAEEDESVKWYVNFQTEERYGTHIKFIVGVYVPPGFGAYDNHYSCNTDRGTFSFAYDPYPTHHGGWEGGDDCSDSDGDGAGDLTDNCPDIFNPVQTANGDGDELGDACDPCPLDKYNDADGDGICGNVDSFPNDAGNDVDGDSKSGDEDNCPEVFNPGWEDTDLDRAGDACDLDDDGDGVLDSRDEFPLDSREWLDADGDGQGNNADPDDDNDGYLDFIESSVGSDPFAASSMPKDNDGDKFPDLIDFDDDGDGMPDHLDAFVFDPKEWFDNDKDGAGDNADADDDNDGYTDGLETAEKSDPLSRLSTPLDVDRDMTPDSTDDDDDGDGAPDASDAFPKNATEWEDTDRDGIGNNGDNDDDNDAYADNVEGSCGSDPLRGDSTPADFDRDFDPDKFDTDDDNDGYLDDADAFALNASEWADTDSDTTGDNADMDDDEDGYFDLVELIEGTNIRDAASIPMDFDNDHFPNSTDTDDDNDEYLDKNDAFPFNANEWLDTDRDGQGNNLDTDDDGDGYPDGEETAAGSGPLNPFSRPSDFDKDLTPDGIDPDDDNDDVPDTADAFPFDASESEDTDGDGMGNNRDADDDNDMFADRTELDPLVGTDPLDSASVPENCDQDLIPNVLDKDDDNDGVPDDADAFDCDFKESLDTDGDGIGDNEDDDDDGDCYDDTVEISEGTGEKNAASAPDDNDKDCRPDSTDDDDDNDTHLDPDDGCPFDPNDFVDTDGEDPCDYADTDDDNDLYLDDKETACESEPKNPLSVPADNDKDYDPDCLDPDDDGDGTTDENDACPFDSRDWRDSDGDKLCDNFDPCPFDVNHDSIGDPCNHSDCNDRSPVDAWCDTCNHNDCLDCSAQDVVGDACVHNDCPDRSLRDAAGNACDHNDCSDYTARDASGDPCNHNDCDDYSARDVTGAPCDHNDCSDISQRDGTGDPCIHNDCSDFSAQDSVGEPCNHNDCSDKSLRDSVGEPCDHDEDDDGIADDTDACPLDNAHDAYGDPCDHDEDDDGTEDAQDACPYESVHDAIGNACNHDEDGDGDTDSADNCPYASNADQANHDTDANGDACDDDDENDTMPDWWEIEYGLNSIVNDAFADKDGDIFTNQYEYQEETNPADRTSYPPFCGTSSLSMCSGNSGCVASCGTNCRATSEGGGTCSMGIRPECSFGANYDYQCSCLSGVCQWATQSQICGQACSQCDTTFCSRCAIDHPVCYDCRTACNICNTLCR